MNEILGIVVMLLYVLIILGIPIFLFKKIIGVIKKNDAHNELMYEKEIELKQAQIDYYNSQKDDTL